MIDDIFAKFDGAFAKNTIRAYRSDFMQYQTWCLENGLAAIPANADTIRGWPIIKTGGGCHEKLIVFFYILVMHMTYKYINTCSY